MRIIIESQLAAILKRGLIVGMGVSLFTPLMLLATEVDVQQKKQLVDNLREQLSSQYVMHEAIPAILESLETLQMTTSYNEASEPVAIATELKTTLQAYDPHFSLWWSDPINKTDKPVYEDWFVKLARKNSGFNRVEILEGNVGYIDLWGMDNIYPESRTRAEAVMSLISDTDAIIFDVRNNGGGSADMVRFLSSYLFAEKVHLNDIYWKQTDSTTEYWTFDDIKGDKHINTPVYVIIDEDTFSAAEEFAYNLQVLKRATLIGETSKGGANPWQRFDLGNGFIAAIPIAKAVNPVTHKNWEGVGVVPDIQADKQVALDVAYKIALQAIQKKNVSVEQQKEIASLLSE